MVDDVEVLLGLTHDEFIIDISTAELGDGYVSAATSTTTLSSTTVTSVEAMVAATMVTGPLPQPPPIMATTHRTSCTAKGNNTINPIDAVVFK